MLTTATECTIPDEYDDDDETDDEKEEHEPQLGPAFSENLTLGSSLTSNVYGAEKKRKHQDRESIGVRDIEWTDEMDGHLWRTYMLYQNDPTVTPFYVPPGGVPPLGVCLRVARVAKSSWKGSKAGTGGARTVSARAPVTPVKGEFRSSIANKADLMRKTSMLKWPASESSTRKRLRILCRRGYGPSMNPYHNHRQDPTQFRSLNRFATDYLSSEPLPPVEDDAEDSDRSVGNALLTSTRSMALSLATSTSVSMRPDSTMAAISGDRPLPNLRELEATTPLRNDPLPEFRSFTNANGVAPPVAVVLASIGLGHPVFPRPTTPISNQSSSYTPLYNRRARANTTIEPPVGMFSMQLSSSAPSHDSWPRRGLRPAEELMPTEEFGGPLPSSDPPVRQPIQGVFDNIPPSLEPKTPPPAPRAPATRTRQRGYTVNIGAPNGLNGKRRARPSDISSPLPTWAYENAEESFDRSHLAQLLGAQPSSAGLPRLGLPFAEGSSSKGKWRSTSDNEEFGPPLPKKVGTFLGGVATGQDPHQSNEGDDSGRPVKRIRE